MRYAKEASGGGLIVRVYTTGETPSDMIEMKDSDIVSKNPDKCRIDQNGNIYEDSSIITYQEKVEAIRLSAISKLKSAGLTDEEIGMFIR